MTAGKLAFNAVTLLLMLGLQSSVLMAAYFGVDRCCGVLLVPQIDCLECLTGLMQVQDTHVRVWSQVQAGGANNALGLGLLCCCLASQVLFTLVPNNLGPWYWHFPHTAQQKH